MTFDDLVSNFALLDDWEDRYRYIIDLGRDLEPMKDGERTPETKVRGCASQVWLVTERETGGNGEVQLRLRGDSDAHIVRGLIAVLIAIYANKTPGEILSIDEKGALSQLGLLDHLSPQRSNGLASMVARIKRDAASG